MRIFSRGAIAASLLLLALIAAPLALNLFGLALLSNAFMVAAFALALNLIAGYAGYPAFGNVVFFGIGAYSTALLLTVGHAPFVAGILAGAAISTLVAIAMAPLLFRLRGHYFAIGTLGLNGAAAQLTTNLPGSGGGKGISLPLPPGTPGATAHFFYYLLLAVLLLTVAVTLIVARGRLGSACLALRQGDDVAMSLGVNPLRTKSAIWALSAALTGVVGAVYAYSLTYIEPSDAFNLGLSVKAFVIVLLGGPGTLVGPLVAAAFVEAATALTQHFWLNWDTGVLGAIVILAIVFFPHGILRRLQRG